MNHRDLAERLKKLSKELKQNSELLAGTEFVREASRFTTHLRRFETKVESAVDVNDPDLAMLKELLASPSAKKQLDVKTLRKLHRDVIGKGVALPADAPWRKHKEAFLQAASQGRYCAKAVAGIRALQSATARNAAVSKVDEETKLIRELDRLGGLTDLEMAEEMNGSLSKEPWVDKLAAAARLRIRPTATLPKKVEAVLRFARRARANLD